MAIIPRTRLPQSPSQPSFAPRGSIVPVQDISGPSQAALSDGMSKVARLAAQKYQEDRNRELQARVMEYDIDRRRSDGIVIDSYLQQFGKNAVDGRAQAFASIEANSQRVRDSITDPEVADLWKQQDAALTNAAYSQLDGHYRQQSLRHQTDTLTERADMLVSTVERVAFGEGYDPATGRLSAEAERTRSAYLDSISQLGNRMGWSPERLANEQRKADTVAYGQIAESLIRSDRFDEAATILRSSSDRMDPEAVAKLAERARDGKARFDQQVMSERVVGDLRSRGLTIQQQLAEIGMQEQSGKLSTLQAKAARDRASELDSRDWQQAGRQRNETKQEFEQMLGQDPTTTYDRLPDGMRSRIDSQFMRGDFEKAAAEARARSIKLDTSVDFSRSVQTLRTLQLAIKEGEINDLPQEVIDGLKARQEQLARQMGRFAVGGEDKAPVVDFAEAMKQLDREVRGTIFPTGGSLVKPPEPQQKKPAADQQGQGQGQTDTKGYIEPEPGQPPQDGKQASAEPAKVPDALGRTEPPADYAVKLERLLSARAASLVPDVKDDRGRIVSTGLHDQQKAIEVAMSHLQMRLRMGDADEFRRYFETGEMPPAWVADTAVQKSADTLIREQVGEGMKKAREANPVGAFLSDYVVDPAGRIFPAAAQVVTDLAVGAANLLPSVDIKSPDIAATLESIMPNGPSRSVARAMIDARRETQSLPAKIVGGAAEMVGQGVGFMAGGPVLGVGGKVVGGAAELVTGGSRVAKIIGQSAGMFGTYGFLSARGEDGGKPTFADRGAQGLRDLAAGAAMGVAQTTVSFALRGLFAADRAALGATEKQVADALETWGKSNKVLPLKNEMNSAAGMAAYGKRLTDAWIGAGMPGAEVLPWKKAAGLALRAGADSVGFSLLDQEFHKDLTEAIQGTDEDAWKRALAKFAGNTLGAAALHMRLSDIPAWQRQQPDGPPVEGKGIRPSTEGVFRRPDPGRVEIGDGKIVDPIKGATVPDAAPPKDATAPQEPQPAPEPKPQEPTRPAEPAPMGDEFGAGVFDTLPRYGWKVETRKLSVEGIPEVSFEMRGADAAPSQVVREMLNLPETVPASEVPDLVRDASIISALRAKAELPGQEISADGIWAEAARGDGDGVMRTIRMGRLYESPVGPEPVWKLAEKQPPRKLADWIEPDQQQAEATLRVAMNERQDLPTASRAMLDEAISVLDKVAAKSNSAVADTMGAIAEVLPAIEKGSREEAVAAIRALGEMLTAKTPDAALEGIRNAAEQKRMDESFGAGVDPAGNAGAIQRELGPKWAKYWEDKNLEPRHQEMLRQTDRKAASPDGPFDPVAEAGKLELPTGKDFERVASVAKEGAAEVSSPGRKLWDFFQRSRVQEVEDVAGKSVADVGRKAATAVSRYEARLTEAGTYEMRRVPRSTTEPLNELTRDEFGGYFTRYQRAMDQGAMDHVGKVELTPGEQKVVDLGRKVFLEAGRIAEEQGVTREDGTKFTVDENRYRLTRQFTPEAVAAREEGVGKLHDAITNWIERKYGIDRAEAQRRFQDVSGVSRQDATETTRKLPVLPAFVEVDGRPVRILETRPLQHTEALARTNSLVMGAHEALPKLPEPATPTPRLESDAGLEKVPDYAQRFIDKVLNEKGRTAAEATARMVRSMFGLEASKSEQGMRFFRPGEPGYNFGRVVNGMLGLYRSAKLTMAFLNNLAEPLGNASHLGVGTIQRAYSESVRRLASGEILSTHRDLVREGWLADSAQNNPWKGDSSIETFEASMRKAGEILTKPLHITQDFNEIVNATAARERLSEMQAGNGTAADRSALKLLGFSPAEATAMLRGEGTPEQYERYKRGIVAAMTGGKGVKPVDRSKAAGSRNYNAVVWFTNFFQTRSRMLDSLIRDIHDSKGDRVEAFGQLAKFAGFQIAQGAIGAAFLAFVKNGADGVVDYFRESAAGTTPEEQAQSVALSAGKMLASGMLGGLGAPLASMFTTAAEPGSSKDAMLDQVGRVFAPFEAVYRTQDFLRSLIVDADVPGYSGLTAIEKVGKFLVDTTPAARNITEGLFGLSAIALTDKNPQLDAALDSFGRWRRANEPQGGSFVTDEANRPLRDAMRAVVERVQAEPGFTDRDMIRAMVKDEDFRAALVGAGAAAMDAQEARGEKPRAVVAMQDVASRLRAKKVLPSDEAKSWTPQERASLFQFLGEKNTEMLRAYDRAIDLLADRIERLNIRKEIEAARQ
mgnify:CR=1 FL=1